MFIGNVLYPALRLDGIDFLDKMHSYNMQQKAYLQFFFKWK